jgi:hypothetical protein
MWEILLHHPWIQTYLAIVGFLLLAALGDHLWHPPPLEESSRHDEGRPATPQGALEKSPIQPGGRIVKPLCPAMPRKSGLSSVKTKAANG